MFGNKVRELVDALYNQSRKQDDMRRNQRAHDRQRDRNVRVYGHAATIHRTEVLDVEVTAAGEVVAVWFRCQRLPFSQSFADTQRANEMRSARHMPRLVAVEVID